MTCAIIIPARLASTRLPGKLLLPVAGKPLLRWTWAAAQAADIGQVYVATADHEIEANVKGWGGQVLRSILSHESGTSRVAEAARGLHEEVEIIVNLQGDEPSLPPAALRQLVESLGERHWDAATLSCPMRSGQEYEMQSVKVVANDYRRALYFSRCPLPGAEKHIGVYAFQRRMLRQIDGSGPSRLARAEGLEQLSWIEAGYQIGVVRIDAAPVSVDTPEDLERLKGALGDA